MISEQETVQTTCCSYCGKENSLFNPHCKHCGKDLPLLLGREQGDDGLMARPLRQFYELSGGRDLPCELGRYHLEKCLKKSALVEVFRATDTLMRRPVVIKAHLNRDATRVWEAGILKEARALARLNHPHIAQVYDCTLLNRIPCLIMEWVSGRPLNPAYFYCWAQFKDLGMQIFSALETAHHHGLVHRDLKPDHLLVCPDLQLKLIDFGLVKRYGPALDSLPETPEALRWKGTPAYMAPEQITGAPPDWRSDMFSLATTLAQCIFGHHPFKQGPMAVTMHRICHAEPQLAPQDHPLYGTRLEGAIRRALAKRPQDRWPSLQAFAVELLEKSSSLASVWA